MSNLLQQVSVVIPAFNEEKRIVEIINEAKRSRFVNEVIVSVDAKTTDNTALVAENAGAIVIQSGKVGFGIVIKQGIKAAKNNFVFKTDGDIKDFSHDWIDRSVNLIKGDTVAVKTYWPQVEHTRSVTFLTTKPIIKFWRPELDYIKMPLSGIYLFLKNEVDWEYLNNDWGFDLDIILKIHSSGKDIKQLLIPEIFDKRKKTSDVIPMAENIVNLLHERFEVPDMASQKILLITAHPDDAEIWCGGTIAKTCLNGGHVKSIVVTGTKERREEAMEAAKLLPNFEPIFLNQGQFEDFIKEDLAFQIADVIHKFKPDILITHQPEDFHLDHRRTSELALLSLLRLRHKNYPRRVFYCNTYFQKDRFSDTFSPDVYFDISDTIELKKELIACHKSQRVEYYTEMIDAMDRMNGLKSGVKYAETFLTCTTHLTNKAVTEL
jgi:LmbE family N-acetylglucosaminyl deacetylase